MDFPLNRQKRLSEFQTWRSLNPPKASKRRLGFLRTTARRQSWADATSRFFVQRSSSLLHTYRVTSVLFTQQQHICAALRFVAALHRERSVMCITRRLLHRDLLILWTRLCSSVPLEIWPVLLIALTHFSCFAFQTTWMLLKSQDSAESYKRSSKYKMLKWDF